MQALVIGPRGRYSRPMRRREFLQRSLVAAGALATPAWLSACSAGKTPSGGPSIPKPFDSIADELRRGATGGLNVFLGGADFVAGRKDQRFTLRIDDEEGSILGAKATLRLASPSGIGPKVPLRFTRFSNGALSESEHDHEGAEEGGEGEGGFYLGFTGVPGGRFVDLVAQVRHEGAVRFGFAAFEVKKSSPVPADGSPGISVPSPTTSDLRGVKNLCTRDPACPMHSVSLDSVVGKKPVVLVIGSPRLCSSGVCGPVLEEVLSLRQGHPDIEFLHAEPFIGDTPTELSPVALAWKIDTEPWTFVMGADGKVSRRFEGPVAVEELNMALKQI